MKDPVIIFYEYFEPTYILYILFQVRPSVKILCGKIRSNIYNRSDMCNDIMYVHIDDFFLFHSTSTSEGNGKPHTPLTNEYLLNSEEAADRCFRLRQVLNPYKPPDLIRKCGAKPDSYNCYFIIRSPLSDTLSRWEISGSGSSTTRDADIF